MTERDDGSGSGGPELTPPENRSSAERRALSDAIRDALVADTGTPERDAPPLPPRTGAGVAPLDSAADGSGAVDSTAVDSGAVESQPPGDEVRPEPLTETETVSGPGSVPGSDPDPESESGDRADSRDSRPDAGTAAPETLDSDSDSDSDSATPPVTAATGAAPDEPSSLEAPLPLDDVPSDEAPPAARRGAKRVTRRGVIAIGARAVTGGLGVLVAVAAIIGATVLPEPRRTLEPPALVVDPVPAAQQRVCPGPLLRLGDDAGQGATTATSVGRADTAFSALPRDAVSASLPQTENTTGVAPLVLTLRADADTSREGGSEGGSDPDTGGAPQDTVAVAGSQSQSATSGDLVGFAAAECAEPSGDSWLVGGSTDVGRTTIVTLSNPSTVAAVVDLEIFGPAGAVSAPGSEGLVVEPGVQRIFSLAGFAPQLVSPIVHVTSRGGLVVANLQQTTVRTLDPGGVDIVGASRGPARRVVIPGVAITSSTAVTDAQGRPGFDDLQTTLRMFAPQTGGSAATATAIVTITPVDGSIRSDADDSVAVEGGAPGDGGSGGFEVELIAGQVTDLPVPGLVDGVYTVTVESAEPIVAGVRTSTIQPDGPTDFAWLPAAHPLADTTLVSAASGPSPVLHLANPSEEDRTIAVVVDGERRELEVEAGASVDAPLAEGRDAVLENASGLVATVGFSGPGLLGAFGITAPGPASTPLTVYR